MNRTKIWFGLVAAALVAVFIAWSRPWGAEEALPEPFFLAERNVQGGQDWICTVTPPSSDSFGFRVTSDTPGIEVQVTTRESLELKDGVLLWATDQSDKIDVTHDFPIKTAWFVISAVGPLASSRPGNSALNPTSQPDSEAGVFSLSCYRASQPGEGGAVDSPFFSEDKPVEDNQSWSTKVDLGDVGKVRFVVDSPVQAQVLVLSEVGYARLRQSGLALDEIYERLSPGYKRVLRHGGVDLRNRAEPIGEMESVELIIRVKEAARIRLECYQPDMLSRIPRLEPEP